ncbi:MAG: type II toxin-antitoxin system VapC family toxin [Parcubacteria group bacterium]|nr:type II toxin-antitoxin system VapC family toxin [Parcubacteria group bacterium]
MTAAYAIDASYALAFLLPDEKNTDTDAVFARYSRGECALFAPHLLPFEALNGLKSAVARKRLNRETAEQLARGFFDLQIPLEEIDFAQAFKIAHQHNLSLYDAAYVQLARETRAPLLTMDSRLRKLCQ